MHSQSSRQLNHGSFFKTNYKNFRFFWGKTWANRLICRSRLCRHVFLWSFRCARSKDRVFGFGQENRGSLQLRSDCFDEYLRNFVWNFYSKHWSTICAFSICCQLSAPLPVLPLASTLSFYDNFYMQSMYFPFAKPLIAPATFSLLFPSIGADLVCLVSSSKIDYHHDDHYDDIQ